MKQEPSYSVWGSPHFRVEGCQLSFDRYYQSDDINTYRAGKEREAELLGLISNNERYKKISEILNKSETITNEEKHVCV